MYALSVTLVDVFFLFTLATWVHVQCNRHVKWVLVYYKSLWPQLAFLCS